MAGQNIKLGGTKHAALEYKGEQSPSLWNVGGSKALHFGM